MMLAVSLMIGVLSGRVATLSKGASYKTCEHMTPVHGGFEPQTAHSIFSVSVSATEYRPKDRINVTIQAECGQSFKGFLLEARQLNTSKLIGSFNTPNGSHYVPDCGYPGQAVTQDGPGGKSNLTFLWTAPDRPAGHIAMVVSFIQDFSTFWTYVKSVPILDINSTFVVKDEEWTPTPWSCPTQVKRLENAIPECREEDEQCISRCIEGNCTVALHWTPQGISNEMYFNLSAVVGEGDNRWIAVGFSRDQLMGEDQVLECVIFEGKCQTYFSRNTEYNNERQTQALNVTDEDLSISIQDGVLVWSFNLPTSFQIDTNQPWYLLVAWGRTAANSDTKLKHTEMPLVSTEMVYLKGTERYESTTTYSSNRGANIKDCSSPAVWLLSLSLSNIFLLNEII